MRLISLTRLLRRPWRARCSAQLVPVAPSSPVPAVVPESGQEEPGECATFRWGNWGDLGGDGSVNIAIMASDCMVINGDYYGVNSDIMMIYVI